MLANARGTVGVLVTVFLVAGGLQQFDTVPVRLEFVSNDLRQRCTDPLPHLGSMTVNFDDVVVANVHIDVRRDTGRAIGCRRPLTARSQCHSENQSTARDTGALQEFPPADFAKFAHDSPPAAR